MLLPLVGLTAGWLAGWLADKMWVDLEIFKILFRLNHLDFYFSIVYNVIIGISTGCSQLKLILRCIIEAQKN